MLPEQKSLQRRVYSVRIVPSADKGYSGEALQMDDNNDIRNEIENAEGPEEKAAKDAETVRWRIFMIIVLLGFLLIFIFVPRIYTAIALKIGWTRIRAIPILLIALFWYIWGQLALYYKNTHNIN